MTIRRYAALYGALWKNSVAREMGFKTNFIMWIVVECLWFFLQLMLIQVIFLHTDHIGTWSHWEVIALMGTSHFIQEIFQAIFFTNCSQLSELVRTGKLDFLLLLPANTRFLVSLRQVDLGGFFNAGSAIAIIIYSLHKLSYVPSVAQIGGFLLLAAASVLIHYSIMFTLATVSFWTIRAQGVVYGYYNLLNVARYPDEAFHGAFKVVFKFVLPMLLVANVPVKVLIAHLSSFSEMFLLVGMSALLFMLSELFWRKSLRHYRSASS